MRLRQDSAFLVIESGEAGPSGSRCRAEAGVAIDGCQVAARFEPIGLDTSAEALDQFGAFAARKRARVEIKLSEGGWLRLSRDSRDGVRVHYRLSRWDVGAAAEGEIAIAPDAAESLCRELGSLLRGEE